MDESLYRLLAYIVWALLLGIFVITIRSVKVLLGQEKSNAFPAWEPHGDGWYWRLHRHHLNTLENLPLVLGVWYICRETNIEGSLLSGMGWLIVAARISQTAAALSGSGVWNVNVRFSFHITQIFALLYLVSKAIQQ